MQGHFPSVNPRLRGCVHAQFDFQSCSGFNVWLSGALLLGVTSAVPRLGSLSVRRNGRNKVAPTGTATAALTALTLNFFMFKHSKLLLPLLKYKIYIKIVILD